MIQKSTKVISLIILLIFSVNLMAHEESFKRVVILQPVNGEKVDQTFEVYFGIEGMTLASAGTYEPATGHHHLIIDADLPDLSLPIPSSSNYLHFGQGQDQTQLTLMPGKHTLQLILGDGNHIPHKQPLISKKIE
ncbi:uncharacterized protein METZ01_LOCUS234587, partial [marine metagenome]